MPNTQPPLTLRPPSLHGAVPQNVDEYIREIYNAVTALSNQVNALINLTLALEDRVIKLENP